MHGFILNFFISHPFNKFVKTQGEMNPSSGFVYDGFAVHTGIEKKVAT